MKVACLMLNLNRSDLALRCIAQNYYNAGVSADVFLIDNGSHPEELQKVVDAYQFELVQLFPENKGIASALNAGIDMAEGYDAIVTLANDILMPPGWLASMIEHAQKIPRSGMIGIHCVEALPPLTDLGVHEILTPFGNVMITREALDAAGKFNTDYDPYGMQDADYAYRLQSMGFVNYYLPNLHSEHIGPDMGQDTPYRAMKNAGLSKALAIWESAKVRYDETKGYKL